MSAILEKNSKEVSPQAEPVSDGDLPAAESDSIADIVVDWDQKEEARIRRKYASRLEIPLPETLEEFTNNSYEGPT